jgi:poly-gamma-glutamate synthesis protein (capsule biosynthesis protein)
MKGKIILLFFIAFFLFCAGQIFGWFKVEPAPADLSSAVLNTLEKKEEYVPEKIIFVGDMMFDRAVEIYMQGSTFSYPVQLIKDFLKGFEFAIGNLEGPVNEKPKEFSDASLMFSFDKRIVESLNEGNFKVVSLANNHTLNMERTGLEETKEILKSSGVNFSGDPIECDFDYSYQRDGITFYAVNVTYPSNCSNKEIAEWVEETKFYNPETFLVVLIHWGEEYKTTNSKNQAELAHKIIDAGADLIIGGHPHVVQNVELYNGKLIFYSLGNFIFDQYFSKETQEGLGVGLEMYPTKKVYDLYGFTNKMAQPQLMEEEEKKTFLESLAEKSSEELKESIKSGKIEINE